MIGGDCGCAGATPPDGIVLGGGKKKRGSRRGKRGGADPAPAMMNRVAPPAMISPPRAIVPAAPMAPIAAPPAPTLQERIASLEEQIKEINQKLSPPVPVQAQPQYPGVGVPGAVPGFNSPPRGGKRKAGRPRKSR